MREGVHRILNQYFFQCSLAAECFVSPPYVPSFPREVACVEPKQLNATVHRFLIATGRHQPYPFQHLPHRQTFGHGCPKLIVGTQALASSCHS